MINESKSPERGFLRKEKILSRKRRKKSWFDILISAAAVMLLVSFASGILRNLDHDSGGNSGGGGSGNQKPSMCAHAFVLGICEKCGTVCTHPTSSEAEDGNEYCTVCGLISKLDSPVLRRTSNIISWDPIPFAQSYEIYLNGEALGSVMNSLFLFKPDYSGKYEISVKATVGNVSSALSDSVSLTFYDVKFNEDNHAVVYGSDHYGVDYPLALEGSVFEGYISPLQGYTLPSDISVAMDGVVLSEDQYSYNESTGDLIITNVTGEIFIDYNASAVSIPELVLNGSVLSWNEFPEAKDYHIHIVDGDYFYNEYFETTETSFDLSELNLNPGVYYISVWIDTGDSFGEPAGITYTVGDNGAPIQLVTPYIYFV